MRLVPWWAVLSSACAPLLLVGGWSVAAVFQGPGYDPAAETISVMAAAGASGRWVLTAALVVLGLCHVVTASGLRAAARAGRLALGCGGLAVIGMALSPVPEGSGGSLLHGWVVGVGFALMALWPVLAADGDGSAPWGLRPTLSLAACTLMGVGALWFLIELQRQGAAGVAERVLTTVQTVWPFVVVTSCLRERPRAGVQD
ncbi:DUF998 domain-containing protein [Streptomyces boluensis]|uniref:DUF998 domain-containing protein n=1 Tax=Streptomyces boluensis TaxID=1775135 RepID=A0A964XNZ3_9ACTN|nr:DUF998 domain-containing protein [Streptomyces boluensis]NBE54292.1 DUF998 domain-containing protein [Streptomyces boluensis]